MMEHNWRAETRSSSGAGGGPLRRRELDRDGLPCESSEVLDVFSCLRREMESPGRVSVEFRGEEWFGWREVEGRISFFCLEAGRISSRSTGTPRETRNSRRMRERIQSGGWRGGGATSWDQREALRWVRKTGLSWVAVGTVEDEIVSGG